VEDYDDLFDSKNQVDPKKLFQLLNEYNNFESYINPEDYRKPCEGSGYCDPPKTTAFLVNVEPFEEDSEEDSDKDKS